MKNSQRLFTVNLLLLVMGILWGIIYFAIDFVNGAWYLIFPLAGLLVGAFLVFKTLQFLVKAQGFFTEFCNMLHNMTLMLQDQKRKNPEKGDEMMRRLMLPPDEFKKQMGYSN